MIDCPIEHIDVDIQVMILRLIPNIESLKSVLNTSPGLYRAFVSAPREKILSAVMYNNYGAEIYPEAVAAARAGMLPRENLSRRQRLDFVREYHQFRSETKFLAVDLHTAISLCQLHWAVQYHIQRFYEQGVSFVTDSAKGLIFGLCNPGLSSVMADLSSVEESRLRRAFFRFQMYGRLFYNATTTDAERQSLFADRISAWEVEEVASVYSYIVRGIQGTFDAAGEDFLDAFITEAALAATVGGIAEPIDILGKAENANAKRGHWTRQYEIRLRGDIDRKPRVPAFADLGGELYQARLKAHMLLSGLGFLRRLFESSGDARLRMVSAREDFGHTFQPPSMNKLLDYALTAHESRQSRIGPIEINHDETESLESSNLAWQWAHSNDVRGDWSRGVYHDLRIWGYVFWDAKRMKPSGILAQAYVVVIFSFPILGRVISDFINFSPYNISCLLRGSFRNWNKERTMSEEAHRDLMRRYLESSR